MGAICAAIGAYLSVRFLTRHFQAKTLSPFAAYCLLACLLSFACLIRDSLLFAGLKPGVGKEAQRYDERRQAMLSVLPRCSSQIG